MNEIPRANTFAEPRQPRPTTGESVIVDIQNLIVDYHVPGRVVRALDSVDLQVHQGERLGIVGESGSGKSTVGAAIGRLLPPSAQREKGALTVDGVEVFNASDSDIQRLRRTTLGFIPQDPIGSLDPTMRVGTQLARAVGLGSFRKHRAAVTNMLAEVLIREPERVVRLFPHELSGGMAQRVAIAIATARRPRILIADEPTAALDSLVREEVLRLIFSRADASGATVLWLSHDLTAVARWCDRVAVMSGGRVVEHGSAREVLASPSDSYTQHLVSADPRHVRFVGEATTVEVPS